MSVIKGQKNESPKRQARWGVRPGLCRGAGAARIPGNWGCSPAFAAVLGKKDGRRGEIKQGKEGEGILAELHGQEGKRPEGGWTGLGRGRERRVDGRDPGRWAAPGQRFRWIFQRISSGGR